MTSKLYIARHMIVSVVALLETRKSVVLVTVWAGFSERVRDGSKFIVADKPVRQGRRNFCAGTEESIVEERKLRKESAENGFFDEKGNESSSTELLNGLFLNE